MRKPVLSVEDLEWAIRQYAKGEFTIRDLARECGVSYSTLHDAFRKNRVPLRRPGHRRSGKVTR